MTPNDFLRFVVALMIASSVLSFSMKGMRNKSSHSRTTNVSMLDRLNEDRSTPSTVNLSPRKQQAGAVTTTAYYYNADFSAESLRNAMLNSHAHEENSPTSSYGQHVQCEEGYNRNLFDNIGDYNTYPGSEHEEIGSYFNF